MGKTRVAWVVSALALLGCAGAAGEQRVAFQGELTVRPTSTQEFAIEGKYPVVLFRAMQPGDRFAMKASMESREVWTVFRETEQANRRVKRRAGSLSAIATVQQTGEGGPPRVRYCVQSLMIDGRPALLAGKVLVREGNTSPRFYLEDGGTLSRRARAVLRDLLQEVPGPRDDAAYMTMEPRVPGEQWDVDPEAFAKIAKEDGLQIDARDVSGIVALAGLEPVEGVDCVRVDSRTHVMRVPADPGEEATLRDTSLRMNYRAWVPVQPARRFPRRAEQEVRMELQMELAPDSSGIPRATSVTTSRYSLSVTTALTDAPCGSAVDPEQAVQAHASGR